MIDENYQTVEFIFLNEDLMTATSEDIDDVWKLRFDGVVNMLGKEIGYVLESPEGEYYSFTTRLSFYVTNNMVEYEACIQGLRAALESPHHAFFSTLFLQTSAKVPLSSVIMFATISSSSLSSERQIIIRTRYFSRNIIKYCDDC